MPFTAGAVLTAAQLNLMNDRHQVKRKASDESVTSSTVLQADNELTFTAVAGETYVFEVCVFAFSTSATPDIKLGFTFPAGTMSFGVSGGNPTISFAANTAATSGTTSLPVGVTLSASPSADLIVINGSFVCTTGGTVTLIWAQNVSDATAMTIKAGSTLTATRVSA